MRTIYNLTDVPTPEMRVPGANRRAPKTLLIAGQTVEPGRSIQVDDGFAPASVASLMATGAVALDHLPAWYQNEKRKASEPVEESVELDEKPDGEAPTRKRKKK